MLIRSQSARCCGERSRKHDGVTDSFVIRSQGVPKLKLRAYMRHTMRQGWGAQPHKNDSKSSIHRA
ncbi:hypothetical protein BRAS3809_7990007 [Bradyrhizobium sp. STM 3809]|nr:hypothetical protein BRAS3809_7990007 [Bradyrhizobium sp. STM 3809]